jgi:hypothetical protein
MLWHIIDPYPFMFYSDIQHRQQTDAEHDALWQAIRDGNVDLTIQLQSEHRADALSCLRRIIIDPSPPMDGEESQVSTAVTTSLD